MWLAKIKRALSKSRGRPEIMLELERPILEEAEEAAARGRGFEDVVQILRKLPLEDFGLFLIGLPNRNYPNLSRVLPAMASADVQQKWTGSSGLELYRTTSAFARVIESNFARHAGRTLVGSTIMDFGCGYGRNMRMLYYYSDAANLWGVDAWKRSLDLCAQAEMPGNFVLSEAVPESLPVGDVKFDLIISFSVFTHLAPHVAQSCLSALRRHVAPDGLLMLTFRPVEFWKFIDGVRGTSLAGTLETAHRTEGWAYHAHKGTEGETYGDTSLAPAFFETVDWRLLGLDRSISDPYQVTAVLAPKSP